MEMDTLWNVGLTAALTLIGFLARALFMEVQRLQLLLNKTREEIARDYVTKAQAINDINRILDKIDALDNKLDRIIERR
jgi:hypothetical protein